MLIGAKIKTVNQTYLDENRKKVSKSYTVTKDEGPRKGTSKEAAGELPKVDRAVFA